MAERTGEPGSYAREVRDTIIKSSLTGVAASVLAVTIFSPAGLGGMIGTSLASGFGVDTRGTAADDAYAHLPPFPSPLSESELSQIRGELARTTAALEITRAATEAKIEHIRSIAATHDAPFAHTPSVAIVAPSVPAPVSAAVTPAPVATPGVEATPTSVSLSVPYQDPNRELAALLFAHENI